MRTSKYHRPEDGVIIYGLAENYGRLALHRVERFLLRLPAFQTPREPSLFTGRLFDLQQLRVSFHSPIKPIWSLWYRSAQIFRRLSPSAAAAFDEDNAATVIAEGIITKQMLVEKPSRSLTPAPWISRASNARATGSKRGCGRVAE
jgi:hypothetical protein